MKFTAFSMIFKNTNSIETILLKLRKMNETCDAGRKTIIQIEIGDDGHIYFQHLGRYHKIGSWDDLNDDQIEGWVDHDFSNNLKCSCK